MYRAYFKQTLPGVHRGRADLVRGRYALWPHAFKDLPHGFVFRTFDFLFEGAEHPV